jgi:hypothetical protein
VSRPLRVAYRSVAVDDPCRVLLATLPPDTQKSQAPDASARAWPPGGRANLYLAEASRRNGITPGISHVSHIASTFF